MLKFTQSEHGVGFVIGVGSSGSKHACRGHQMVSLTEGIHTSKD